MLLSARFLSQFTRCICIACLIFRQYSALTRIQIAAMLSGSIRLYNTPGKMVGQKSPCKNGAHAPLLCRCLFPFARRGPAPRVSKGWVALVSCGERLRLRGTDLETPESPEFLRCVGQGVKAVLVASPRHAFQGILGLHSAFSVGSPLEPL